MPFTRLVLSKIKSQIAADIQSALPGTDPLLRFSNLGITGSALANMVNSLYGYLDWISRQAVPFTSTEEFLYAWGALKNVIPLPAVSASNGKVTFTGQVGAIIPDQSIMSRGDGSTFTTQGQGTIGAGGTVAVSSTADIAGADGNTAIGSTMTLGIAISGINSSGSVTTTFSNGVDTETETAFRTRMLQVYQNPPQGGAQSDYETWAMQFAGVTRAWCKPSGMGVGSAVVYIMMDVTELAFNGFPQGTNGVATLETRAAAATGDQLLVANHIYPLRPVTALVYVCAPAAQSVNFTISGLSTATVSTKALISDAIKNVFVQYGTPLVGVVDLSYIEAAIAAIPSTEGFVITAPSGNIATTIGNIPTLGTITYS